MQPRAARVLAHRDPAAIQTDMVFVQFRTSAERRVRMGHPAAIWVGAHRHSCPRKRQAEEVSGGAGPAPGAVGRTPL